MKSVHNWPPKSTRLCTFSHGTSAADLQTRLAASRGTRQACWRKKRRPAAALKSVSDSPTRPAAFGVFPARSSFTHSQQFQQWRRCLQSTPCPMQNGRNFQNALLQTLWTRIALHLCDPRTRPKLTNDLLSCNIHVVIMLRARAVSRSRAGLCTSRTCQQR